MRITLVLTTIIFAALLMYAKLLAIADGPTRVYTTNGSRTSMNSSEPVAGPSQTVQSSNADSSCDDHTCDDHSD